MKKAGKLIFPAFLLVVLATYYPSIGAGFVFDFVGWQSVYDKGSFADILNCFGYKGNQQVYHLFYYSIYWLFHLSGVGWYLIFCTLHAFNGWLLFKWLTAIKRDWKIELDNMLILPACIFYLVHPYCVEVVVFKACVHYLLSLAAILGLLILAPKYIFEQNQKYFWLCLLIFFLSVFALEIAYITPLVITVYTWMQIQLRNSEINSIQRAWKLPVALWGVLFLSLVINRVTIGSWIGHYGAETHLRFDFFGMLATEGKYFIKHMADARMMEHGMKTVLFDKILSNKVLNTILLLAGLIGTIIYIARIKRVKSNWHLIVFSLLASLFFTLPVSNLFFYYLGVGTNDRFSYIPLAFISVFILGIFSFWKKQIGIILFAILILVQVFLQQKILGYWKKSTVVLTSLKADYRWHDRSHVFVLNSPDNYRGVWMTSMLKGDSGIDELIDYQTPKPNQGIMYDIYQFNMNEPNEGVSVEQTGPMQLKVTFNQYGNWWHHHGLGGGPYENDFYKAETQGQSYLLDFKKFPEESAIIYQDSMKWKEFDLNANYAD